MSSIGADHPLIIETRRFKRAAAKPRENTLSVSGLCLDRHSGDREGKTSWRAPEAKSLSRPETEHAVPFRHGAQAPRLDSAFVAQLLGQVMPQSVARPSGALAAYQPPSLAARICDLRL